MDELTIREIHVEVDGHDLPGTLAVPSDPSGLVAFAHGSGSSRHSPRNRQVADGLNDAGLATLLFDLLTTDEGQDRANVFDIDLLSDRVVGAIDWLARRPDVGDLPIGVFGASTGAAAALNAGRLRPDRVRAVVSRGGRVDLAGDLAGTPVPSLLIVGGDDPEVLRLNRQAAELLPQAAVEVVPGAGHLFEGPGELERVTELAAAWFLRHLAADAT